MAKNNFLLQIARELTNPFRKTAGFGTDMVLRQAGEQVRQRNPFLSTEEFQRLNTPSGVAKEQAKNIAGIGSFVVPAGKAAQGASFLQKILAAGKAGAAVGGLQRLSQDNATLGNVTKGALGGAAGAGILQGTGSILNKILKAGGKAVTQRLPEQLMSGVFKQPLKDTRAAIKGGKTLGQEALERGIKGGSDESIYTQAVQKINEYEDQLQSALSNSKRIVPLSDIKKAIQPLITKYSKAGNTNAVSNITNRINALEQYNGKSVPVAVANEIKRTLYDEARGGYGQLASENIEGVKAIAKALKDGIASKVKGASSLNKELSVQGRIADSLIDKIARTGRNNLLGLSDYGIGGVTGVAAGGPAALGAIAGKKLLGSTGGKTYLANILNAANVPAKAAGASINSVADNPILKQVLGQGAAKTGSQVFSGEKNSEQTNSANYEKSAEELNNQFTPPEGNTGGIIPQIPETPQFGTQISPQMVSMAYLMLDKSEADKIKSAFDIQQEAIPKNKPLSVSAENKKQLGESGIRALNELDKILSDDPNAYLKAAIPGKLGARKYDSAAFRSVEALLRARSGAAVPETEVRRYMSANLPRVGDTKDEAAFKLAAFRKDIQAVANSGSSMSPEEEALQLLQQQGILGF